jgi:hypothetical protein
MSFYEQLYNVGWVVAGTAICTRSFQLGAWDANGPGAGFIPFCSGALVAFVGVLLFFRELRKVRGGSQRQRFWTTPAAAPKVAYILLGLCVMVILIPLLGFLVTSMLITYFMLQIIEPQKWYRAVATSLASCLLVYGLFSYLLQVSLPRGLIGI